MDEEVQLVRQKGRLLEEGRLTDMVTDRSEGVESAGWSLISFLHVASDVSPLFTQSLHRDPKVLNSLTCLFPTPECSRSSLQ